MKWVVLFILFFGTVSGIETKTFKDQQFETLTFNGNLTLDHCDFLLDLIVTGEVKANHCRIDLLNVDGKTSVRESLFRAPIVCQGEFDAHFCVFAQGIELQTKLATFERCLIENITVRPIPYYDGPQIIHLTGGAYVKGNITFEGRDGEVYLSKDSRFAGAVIGGKIVPFAK